MSVGPVSAIPVGQIQAASHKAAPAAAIDSDGDNDGSPPAASLPQGSTVSAYA